MGIQEKKCKMPNSAVFKIRKGNRKPYLVTFVTSNTKTYTFYFSLWAVKERAWEMDGERRAGSCVGRRGGSLRGREVDKNGK